MSEDERRQIHEVVGIGAVKYADLSQNRTSDYKFTWDKMLAMDGNTATYMQYAYVRNRSILRRGEVDDDVFRKAPSLPLIETAEERALAVQLLRFEEALAAAAAEYKPSRHHQLPVGPGQDRTAASTIVARSSKRRLRNCDRADSCCVI